MRTVAYRDNLDRPVYDVTEEMKALCLYVLPAKKILRAEVCDNNLLTLSRDGKRRAVAWWALNQEASDLTAAAYTETVYFKLNELDPAKPLFPQINLF